MKSDQDGPNDQRQRERIKAQTAQAIENLLNAGASDIVILCSWPTENGLTSMLSDCHGSWYAANGMMDYFLRKRLASASLEAADQHNRQSDE